MRHYKAEEDIKTENVKVRMKTEDYKILRETAEKEGLSISAFCRIVLKERCGIPEEDWDYGRKKKTR